MKLPLPIHPDDRIACAPYNARFSARACAEHHARAVGAGEVQQLLGEHVAGLDVRHQQDVGATSDR